MGRFHERFSAHARLSVDWVDSDHGNCESRFFLTILALLGNKNGKSKRNCLRIFPGPDCVVQARHLYENTNVALTNLTVPCTQCAAESESKEDDVSVETFLQAA